MSTHAEQAALYTDGYAAQLARNWNTFRDELDAVTVVPNRADRRRNHTRTATRADQQTSPRALHIAGPRLMPRSSNPAHRKLVARLIRRADRIREANTQAAQDTENTE